MEDNEIRDRLVAIKELVERHLNSLAPMILYDVYAQEEEWGEHQLVKKPAAPKVIISCDASIKVNPGGPSAVGVVIEINGAKLQLSQGSVATSNNQAEYDAIYFGLTTLMTLHNNAQLTVEVRSDSQLVIRQLNGDIKCNDEKLQRKRDLILEYVKQLPVPVEFVWRPRNSTPELKLANYLAQDFLGVPRH
jgi:ribonuclease HI